MPDNALVKVLIIDEGGRKEAKYLAKQLEKLSQLAVKCVLCTDVPMATAALLQRGADVVFIDAHYIESDNEILATIREMSGDCSIVALTRKEDEHKSLEFLRAGADDCFVKDNFSSAQLMVAMHRACGFSMLRRERSMVLASKRTAQRGVEEEKLMLKEELLESRKLEAIGQLAGGVAHDFNNILGAISGYAELIRQRFGADNPKLEKYSSTILAAARRAAELTAQLLTFARKGSYRREHCDVHELLNRTIQLLHRSLDSRIKIRKDFRAADAGVKGDPTQLQTAFLNIAMNACDAMPDGGSLVFSTDNVVFDESYKQQFPSIVCGAYVLAEIIDTGIGMDEHVKGRLFEPFFTTKDLGKGSGLHLASVHGTIKAHNGYCAVSSEPGRGSVFKIYIPADRVQPEQETDNAVVAADKQGASILVVDDEELMRSIYKEMLGSLGYSVEVCGSGHEAIEVYSKYQTSIDLVIIDMIMGEINGLECFRELKKTNPRLRAILASGYDLGDKQAEILSEGFTGVIKKPFEIQMLLKAVSDALQKTI
jgi:signal transduction histidine kinase/ActR/RegA family two-component response regulator